MLYRLVQQSSSTLIAQTQGPTGSNLLPPLPILLRVLHAVHRVIQRHLHCTIRRGSSLRKPTAARSR